jgi:6-methylsalicylate decarboxylase
MICDVHAHCMPTAVSDILTGGDDEARRRYQAVAPMSDSEEDIEGRLALMDAAGIDVQVLSLPPVPVLPDEEATVRVVRAANDALAGVVARRPERFLGYAELPLPYVDASLRELERCRSELGLRAVNLMASSGTTSAVAEELAPLHEALDRSHTIVLIHPRVNGLCSALVTDYALEAPLGPVLEDSVIVAQIVRTRLVHRFPHLEVIIPHLGGVLPIYVPRMDNQMGLLFPDLPELPSETVRRLWFDTMAHCSAPALRSACDVLGAERLLTGSDYPVPESHEGYAASIDYIRHAGLADTEVEQILHGNAPRLFGLT